ncbi:MAG TPA: prephenate dehydratase [Chthoniobacterales bacterium]|nr:prephenate dehydratase [Chthoniobacterales bacterium]
MEAKLSLDQIRIQIDRIDTELLRLLNERADLVHEIGTIKKNAGLPIYAPEREESLLQGLIQKNKGRLPAEAIRAIYREIMSASLALEKDLTIAFLGPEATWTHQAARSKFGLSVKYTPESSISDVFARVTRRTADYGVVPIENSLEGAVNHTLDVFMDSELKICAQILLRIRNDLLSKWPRDQIKKIYSHPQVFGQCRQWLQENARDLELIEVSSTTRAAQIAATEPGAAALASSMAAEVYGLQVLETSVQDSPNNTTRFLVISPAGCPVTGNDKTSLMFSIQDRVGALYSALEPFSRLKLSMSKIESRPSKRKNWEYFFFVDFEGHIEDPVVSQAIKELGEHCTFVKVLGSYPRTEL